MTILRILALLSLHIAVQAQGMPGCDCDRAQVIASINGSDTIFLGRIVKASMASSTGDSIQIWAESIRPIRGTHNASTPIVTPTPLECGIPAHIGGQMIFAVSYENYVATRCETGAAQFGTNWLYLGLALATIELWDTNPDAVQDWLNGFGPFQTLEGMQGYFDMLEEIDPDSDVTRDGDLVHYKGITFDFSSSPYTVQWE